MAIETVCQIIYPPEPIDAVRFPSPLIKPDVPITSLPSRRENRVDADLLGPKGTDCSKSLFLRPLVCLTIAFGGCRRVGVRL
jgi:hypothetical protein